MKQTLIGGTRENCAVAGTEYSSVYAGYGWGTSAASRDQIVTTPGTLRKLKVKLSAAPSAGDWHKFAIALNGVAQSLAVTISNTDTSGEDLVNEVAVVAGDTICIVHTTASAAVASTVMWNIEFEGTNTAEVLLLSCGLDGHYSWTVAHPNCGYWPAGETEPRYWILFPSPGTIKNLYVKQASAPGGTKTVTWTVRKNLVNTTVAVAITGANKTGNSGANSFTVAAGDVVTLKMAAVSGTVAPGLVNIGLTFVADTDGDIPVASGSGGTFSASAATKIGFAENTPTMTPLALPVSDWQRCDVFTLSDFYVKVTTAPGAGKQWVITIQKNGVDTALTVTISGAAVSGNFTASSVDFVDGDTVSIVMTPSGTPASTYFGYGAIMRVAAAGAKCYGLHAGAMAEMLS